MKSKDKGFNMFHNTLNPLNTLHYFQKINFLIQT